MEAVHAMTSEDTPVPEIEEEVKEEEDLLKGLQRVILEQEDADMGGGESDVARSTASAMQPAPQQPAAAAAQARRAACSKASPSAPAETVPEPRLLLWQQRLRRQGPRGRTLEADEHLCSGTSTA
eukprot:CAMPEP_0175775430 /NCGR_PEP_ID=MMETSP0097-20121207/74117_1 /TAXON_ID=311494 /ORGANISM="Alexandrium monilatum, Strain CCMP3105" /LENGTH=124 /DNA_ID=CAMNT_0017085927 /DNA_START=72 /DNA_END=446 /DNA_ORIENTATION=+